MESGVRCVAKAGTFQLYVPVNLQPVALPWVPDPAVARASGDGPQSGAPAIVGAGMVGDRADVIFSSPEEITGFIGNRC
jgi:hypothetical protein